MASDATQELIAELQLLRLRVQSLEQTLARQQNDNRTEGKSVAQGAGQDISRPGLSPRPCISPVADVVTMDVTRVVMHQIVMPTEVDTLGICFGGQVLSWIDVCAGMAAKTLARGPCVTISVDAVQFFRPCRLGHVVMIGSMVNRTFNSSMEVGVRVEAEDMRTGVRWHCCSAYLTFVALTNKRQGRPLPRVAPRSENQQRVHAQAEGRRQQRLNARQQMTTARAAAVEACRLKPVTHREGCPTLPPALTMAPCSSSRAPSDSGERDPPVQLANRRAVAPSATTAYMTQSIMPQHANTLGLTFGGQVMWWMEQCAYISASRVRGGHLLTAGMDSVAFARTTRVGDIMYITAQVTAIFNSSLEVMISVFAETPQEGVVFHCADAYATVVVVDAHCRPMASSFKVEPETEAEKLRHQGAVDRRDERLLMRTSMKAAAMGRPSLDGGLLDHPVMAPWEDAGAAGQEGAADDEQQATAGA